ncbi:medium-chain fatty acid-CoA ligase faa2 [Massospora cicadina]|nr:medium-chain fatty acid-CoA ligase faa2 [Massospora cicadina]
MQNPRKVGIEVPNTKKPNQTAVIRCHLFQEHFLTPNSEFPKTVYEGWKTGPDTPLFGKRVRDPVTKKLDPYEWETYDEVRNRVLNFSCGLEFLRRLHSLSDKVCQWPVGIYAINRPEWAITDLANVHRNLYTVALYDTYGQDALCFVIEHAELSIIVASSGRVINLLKEASKLPSLKVIVCMDELPKDAPDGSLSHALREWAKLAKLQLYDFKEVEALGIANPVDPIPPSPQDIYTICYTSGTTGNPKGAISSHWNYASSATTAALIIGLKAESADVYLSFLPLAHTYERLNFVNNYQFNNSIGFYSGSILGLMDDIGELRPTIIAAVPRILHRIYDRIAAVALEGQGLGPSLFRIGLQKKLEKYRRGEGAESLFWDSLIFNKVRKLLGGRVRSLLTGSAPLAPEVLDFLRVVLCPLIFEGYGLTETAATGCLTLRDEYRSGHVGPPVLGTQAKLVDIPEMDYLTTDKPFPRGEICFKGGNVFLGYYKDPEKTAEVIDSEGWFHTGDVGLLDERGNFKIIDRKKNLFKLSQGEYVAPEKIENVLVQNNKVAQAFVYGDSLKSHLIAIVVPEPEPFLQWAKLVTKDPSIDLAAACSNASARKALVDELDALGKQAGLQGFELVRALHLEPVPFSEQNGLITPTMKTMRPAMKKAYQKILDQLYEETS